MSRSVSPLRVAWFIGRAAVWVLWHPARALRYARDLLDEAEYDGAFAEGGEDAVNALAARRAGRRGKEAAR